MSEKQASWYRSWLDPQGGPVLELACGTGRLLCHLARAGFSGMGIELSRTMLAIARQNQRALPERARRRITWRNADMTTFSLPGSFQAAIIADNSFTVLPTRKQQTACLRNIRVHLRPGGLLLMAVRRFDPSAYKNGHSETGWSQPVIEPTTGRQVSRNIILKADADGRRQQGEYQYRVMNNIGKTQLFRFPFSNPLMIESDYAELFKKTGYSLNIYADYSFRAPDAKTRMLCLAGGKNHTPDG